MEWVASNCPLSTEIIPPLLNNYGALLLKGTGVTVLLAIVGTLAGFLIGLLIGIYKTLPIRKEDRVASNCPLSTEIIPPRTISAI